MPVMNGLLNDCGKFNLDESVLFLKSFNLSPNALFCIIIIFWF